MSYNRRRDLTLNYVQGTGAATIDPTVKAFFQMPNAFILSLLSLSSFLPTKRMPPFRKYSTIHQASIAFLLIPTLSWRYPVWGYCNPVLRSSVWFELRPQWGAKYNSKSEGITFVLLLMGHVPY